MQAGNVRCPTCSRVLKPPARAQRFRCPCGQILSKPRRNVNTPTITTNTAPNLPIHQHTAPPNNQNNTTNASTTQARVRCPQCSTILIPPAGASVFRCTCGLTLRAPAAAPARPSTAARNAANLMRNTLNQASATLSRPQANAQAQPANNISRNRGSVLGMIGNRFMRMAGSTGENQQPEVTNNEGPTIQQTGPQVDENLAPEQMVEALTGSNQEYWLRNLGEDEKICWVRLMSTEQEEKIAKLLSTWEGDMKKKIQELEIYDLKTRIQMLEIFPNADLTDMEEMKDILLNAKQKLLSSVSMDRVTDILNNLHVDHTTCVTLEQLVERLLAAVWYGPTRLCDGFVREFTGEFELDMVPAQQYGLALDYNIHKVRYDVLEDLTQASFKKKVAWFKDQCDKHRTPWEQGRVEIKIDRNDILQDSFYKFQKLKPEDFKKKFKFEFEGEIGIDAGGLSREWFMLVTDACFNVDCGLFEYSGVDNICYQFNPNSGIANDLHLDYFRFIGRIVGKALFDQQYVKAHLTQPLFKHILGYPITVEDIEFCDQKIYENLKALEEVEDVSDLMLTFSCTISVFGEYVEVELKPGGADMDVTNANVQEYILLMTKHYMFERTKSQLVYFLKGIYDVIPEVWLSIFDYREFELLLCGLPKINVSDWKSNTRYRGEYAGKKERHKVIKWFWEYVESRNQEQKARLLQFCTGTSRVPVQGFGALQGRAGEVTPFTLEAVSTSKFIYPRAHTCFNRLDLPVYKTRKDLFRRLEEACSISMTGFNDE